jgi:hypothetical protein
MAKTPMTIPSSVNDDRSLFERMESQAIEKYSAKLMVCDS